MNLEKLLQYYMRDKRTEQILASIEVLADARLHLKGLTGSMDRFLAAAIYKKAPQNHVFILQDKEEAAYFQNDLKNILDKKDILFFPDSFKKPGKFEEINKNNVLLRTETLGRLIASETTGELLVTYPQALFEKLVSHKALDEKIIHLKMGESMDVNFIIELLVDCGFVHTDFVYEPGQFSVRGDIADIFSFGNDLPYRVELFGEEIESIRVFDPLSQLSTKKINHVTIVPNIQTQFDGKDKTSFFKLLPSNTTIWVKDMEGVLGINQKCYDKALAIAKELKEKGVTLTEESMIFGSAEENSFVHSEQLLHDLLDFSIIEFGLHAFLGRKGNEVETLEYKAYPQPIFSKNFQLLIKDLQNNDQEGIQNVIFAEQARQIRRFESIFEDIGEDVQVSYIAKSIHQGFLDLDLKIACYTDHQIFERFYKYQVKEGYSKKKAMSVKLLKELKPGDYVTHIDHGVGEYTGLKKIESNGQMQEVMRILYKDKDILYVNINSLHKVAKYVGRDGKKPKINKLGSDAWAAVKRKAKRKIKDIAADLIKLYAKRKASKGFSFAPDTYMQTELEASFIYEDTPDQLSATQDVKADMEKENPMDRLVCGDVGFGKTEIAVRAAAKAVADNKQVAILVPTTILALQHFQTFRERLRDFPTKVDYLNRFKTSKQKKETLAKLAEGKVDIIIGTHALLSKAVKFKDLGLLIIDEEQKFGVAAKEKLRSLKVNVDTLILTATPIPRTLQFSLMNARDLSVIRTPPPNRQPVETEVIRFENEKIREAINYEIYRGGQVFFIHNRVKDLKDVMVMIKNLCPDADVDMAHGQLDNKTLEEKLLAFIEGKFNVLVSTNIVEAGLDISNANTMIINNAHFFGLSDLHQLRGRVGRSNRKAFCYLISPPIFSLSDDSRKRLQAIEEFADLGSGIKIAMRDLDIRGSGNLLGGEQSGFIADIGFNTYQKILQEAIQELKETDFKEVFQEEIIEKKEFVQDCQVDTDLEILIPDDYVNSVDERLQLYTELDNIETEDKLKEFAKNLKDRFGPLPPPVKELLKAVQLRWVAKRLGFERIVFKKKKLRGYFVSNQSSPYYQTPIFASILKYAQFAGNNAYFKQSKQYFLLVFDHIHTVKQAHKQLLELEEFVSGG
ncbi:MAG: transcription-repair coupling factor [Chitinophagales bacterium]